MKLKFIILIMGTVLCCMILSGCTTSRSDTLARILKELETENALLVKETRTTPSSRTRNYDKPDHADTGLPPMKVYQSPLTSPAQHHYKPEDLEITIQPGSLLQITVQEDSELDGNYAVNEIGAIDLGYIGPIILLNKNILAAARKITTVLTNRDFRRATVSVKIIRASYDRVHLNGGVNNPGDITIGAGDTISLNDAILRAGGIKASMKGARIKVVSGGLTNAMAHIAPGRVYSLTSDKGEAVIPNIMLKNNDIATVLSTASKIMSGGGEKEITVLGEVKRPGIFRFSGEEPCTMMHLMFKVGELSLYANKKSIRIYRKNNRGFEEEIIVNAEKIMDEGRVEDDVILEHNDRIVVPRIKFHIF